MKLEFEALLCFTELDIYLLVSQSVVMRLNYASWSYSLYS
jgi:hypothetical protein